ncbi:MAG: LPS export ABC transporter periplasmic protein LptC [Alphaproteobacteria bacterium]|nr:LPS export ABC transporter periplasmic protein LptC [Alphaproteobacteria bacterium]
MVDLKKIDTYFNKPEAYHVQKREVSRKSSRKLRFLKLLMPSVAAVLLALVLLAPHFEKQIITDNHDLTIPKKGELEKLHAEKAVFSTTDHNGKVSTFTADAMDETEPASKVVKIIRPKGKIPLKTENAFVDVRADLGYFDQGRNYIIMEQKVKAVYDNETTIETEYADYDFAQALAQGDRPVVAYGTWGKLWAEGFKYDKSARILYLEKKSKLVHEDSVLTANKQIRYYQDLNKIEAEGMVVLTTAESTLHADKAIIWFNDAQNMQIKKVEAFGHVEVVHDSTMAKAQKGVYLPTDNKIELQGNVSIEKDGNIVYGDKAETNLETMVSKVTMDHNNRVSGVIKGLSIRRAYHEKK